MPVPFEAFIPMGLVVVMFGITGTGFNIAKRMTNDGKVRPFSSSFLASGSSSDMTHLSLSLDIHSPSATDSTTGST